MFSRIGRAALRGWVSRIGNNTINRAKYHTLWLVKMSNTFCTLSWIDDKHLRPHRNSLIGTFIFANITVDACVKYFQAHTNESVISHKSSKTCCICEERITHLTSPLSEPATP